jgi:hypothetical protein
MRYSLLYGAEDPSIAGMVLDSAFTNLYDLMLELVDVYKIRVPKFTVCPATPSAYVLLLCNYNTTMRMLEMCIAILLFWLSHS